ncbi:TetR/AcrR family transcriptional regulator [Phaeacidiphilus oryzae]|uniref:TetR/AcrR family transcriptional regulator n=1 Tax=Phaeacidiphilus oryzae TaxID=348818 RepID=UPI00055C182F|nr:TetR/AcrR family transcriptional regulator [Phaeacidiphilus oryzae]
MDDKKASAPQRSDALRNRRRILEVALAELTRSDQVPLSAIARKAGVGQGTFYRNFPSREALVLEVYRYEAQQVAESADQLLATREPDRALREWMDRLARFAAAKAGLADAIRQATSGAGEVKEQGYAAMTAAAERLLRACEEAGAVRPGLTAEDFFLLIAGLWQLAGQENAQPQLTRLLDLIMDGLRAGAAAGGTAPSAPAAPAS